MRWVGYYCITRGFYGARFSIPPQYLQKPFSNSFMSPKLLVPNPYYSSMIVVLLLPFLCVQFSRLFLGSSHLYPVFLIPSMIYWFPLLFPPHFLLLLLFPSLLLFGFVFVCDFFFRGIFWSKKVFVSLCKKNQYVRYLGVLDDVF